MALKTTIPTLEIKTEGTDLSLIEDIYITIKTGTFQTIKSNDDIEVDNDMISVSLSQEDSAQISGSNGVNVSIMAVGYDGSISNVKIVWVKRGSRTNYENGGSGGTSVSNMAWYPAVSENGDLSWYKTESEIPPEMVNIKGEKGDAGPSGPQGEKGDMGPSGPQGEKGETGFSPQITENKSNTEDVYKLDITTATGAFTTPNLKGGGSGGGSGGDAPSGGGLYMFEIRTDGNLWIVYENQDDVNRFHIDSVGNLICTF